MESSLECNEVLGAHGAVETNMATVAVQPWDMANHHDSAESKSKVLALPRNLLAVAGMVALAAGLAAAFGAMTQDTQRGQIPYDCYVMAGVFATVSTLLVMIALIIAILNEQSDGSSR